MSVQTSDGKISNDLCQILCVGVVFGRLVVASEQLNWAAIDKLSDQYPEFCLKIAEVAKAVSDLRNEAWTILKELDAKP